jgi:hypothetical protein
MQMNDCPPRFVNANSGSVSGTHRGEFLGVKATGRRIQIPGSTWHRFEGGSLRVGIAGTLMASVALLPVWRVT